MPSVGQHRVMKLLLCSALLLLPIPMATAEPAATTPSTPAAYVEALGVAHAFLDAWVSRDADKGIRLMSPTLRQTPRGSNPSDYESWLRLYVQGLSNPHHAAFELGRGTLAAHNRAVFPVTLYEFVTGESAAFSYSSSLELVREGESWRVSKLPQSSDNEK